MLVRQACESLSRVPGLAEKRTETDTPLCFHTNFLTVLLGSRKLRPCRSQSASYAPFLAPAIAVSVILVNYAYEDKL